MIDVVPNGERGVNEVVTSHAGEEAGDRLDQLEICGLWREEQLKGAAVPPLRVRDVAPTRIDESPSLAGRFEEGKRFVVLGMADGRLLAALGEHGVYHDLVSFLAERSDPASAGPHGIIEVRGDEPDPHGIVLVDANQLANVVPGTVQPHTGAHLDAPEVTHRPMVDGIDVAASVSGREGLEATLLREVGA